ncbi:MAG: hypothetical protein ACK417_06390 [Bacteroidia bacterium]
MISVLSRRQLLNGSKLLLVALLAFNLGCKASKSSGSQPQQPPALDPAMHERPESRRLEPKPSYDSLAYKADLFRIGLLFPGTLDSTGQWEVSEEVLDAISGFMLAFDTLHRAGLRAEVKIKLGHLDQLPRMRQNNDLVVHFNHGNYVAYYDTLSWVCNPGLEYHTARLANYWQWEAPEIMLVHRGTDVEKMIAESFMANAPSKSRNLESNRVDIDFWKQHFKRDQTNYVYLCSPDERYVSRMIQLWSSLEDYDILLAGLPNWERFLTLNGNLMETFRVILSQSVFMDESHDLLTYLRTAYTAQYEGEARTPVIKAFDHGFYFGRLLLTAELPKEAVDLGSMSFDFNSPVMGQHQNTAVRLIQFSNYTFNLLP